MSWSAQSGRYDRMPYRRCGASGVVLPAVSLGLWNNFGAEDDFDNARRIILEAFDNGICHFDLANNYGPPPGSAEENFGRILRSQLSAYRDELIIATKAGHPMWPGPYGDWGSRKHLLASLDQSLLRMGLEYVDIFYSHRPDEQTPLQETLLALEQAVRAGKALYAGISKYPPDLTKKAAEFMRSINCPLVVHQRRYSMLNRDTEQQGLPDVLKEQGLGCVVFSPLAQGLLSDKYLSGKIPSGSRAAKDGFLKTDTITPATVEKLNRLNEIALARQQSLAQTAIAWLLRDEKICSVIIGASRPEQIGENLKALKRIDFSDVELEKIETILKS